MTSNPTPDPDFDGCNSECRRAGAHTLRWGGCEHAPEPEPTVSLSRVYTDVDGDRSIGFDTYTVPQLAELIMSGLRASDLAVNADDFAEICCVAAQAIVHRNDPAAPPAPPSVSAVDQTTRDRIAEALAPFFANFSDWETARINAGEATAAVLAVLPPPADRAAILAEVLPAWEAVYEPGNVSDYLIGYANDQDAATGMAEAWMRSQAEVTGRLEWVSEERMATDRYDRWFELIERHGDGIDTGPGIVVRRRLADEAQQPAVGARHPKCVLCGHRTCTLGQPCGVIATERGDLPEPCGCTGVGARQPDTETHSVTVHAIPLPGSNGISSCCGRAPCEFVGERVTRDPAAVTCPGPAASSAVPGRFAATSTDEEPRR